MTEQTSTPTPTPNPAPKTKTPRKDINQSFLDELSAARKVAASAQDDAYTGKLAEVELDPALPGQINDRAAEIEGDIANLKTARVAKTTATKQETDARDALVAVIAPIQTAARRKFTGETVGQRDAYYIGSKLATDTLGEVLIAAKNVYARLVPGPDGASPQDELPGIKADGAIQNLAAAIAKYDTKNTEQGEQQGKASATLESIELKVNTLAGLRRAVQLAADQAWPWRSEGVASIRKDFLLPAKQPMKD